MDEADLEAIRRLLAIADTYHLRELVVDENGLRVTIRAEAPASPTASPLAGPAPADLDALTEPEPPVAEPDEDPSHHVLRSPMTGIFYRSPSPEAPPFVVEGQLVEEDQTVGLIEAMKVFSEIHCDASGRVIRVVAEAGKLLQEGDVLLVIDTLGE